MESSHLISHTVQIKELAAMLKVDVKYWDSGDNFQLGVACEFGPHVTVGVGSTRMVLLKYKRQFIGANSVGLSGLVNSAPPDLRSY